MQFFRRILNWCFQGQHAWFASIVAVFFIFLWVYKALVPPSEGHEKPFTLPSKPVVNTIRQHNIEVAKSDQDYNALLSTDPLQQVEQAVVSPASIEYVIKSGDTLAKIFNRFGLSKESMYAVLEADQEYLVLEPLLPNDKFTFKLDAQGQLQGLTRRLDISKSVSFVRHGSGGFTYEEHIKPISYTQTSIHSKIVGNFYLSAKKLGLSDNNILIIHDVLKGRVNFRKDLRANDEFDLVVKNGSIDGVQVGDTQIEALQFVVQGKTYRAFLHSDGRFYDQDGKSLTPALLRWPTSKHYRISSPFNANRLHPITGHRAPHNGVDLATPVGTKILATGDGVVTRVASHKYAGKYIVIDYTGPYGARYLHLNKILVKKGQKVKRGQVIALSGNTGRTTGAHLHYELHVRGRPVNPMTAKIPTAQSVPSEQMPEYEASVARWIDMMSHPSSGAGTLSATKSTQDSDQA
ncbi:peptidoglycan DD-metalloendopeptidase family protein [Marinomonas sp. THO17]|uniref:peptidoglycan DD-metalloendopeptidase family protein n=1 Tax=Marinomonas sp. THO17 TaxID=3149048 RepID=UPI00336C0C16